MQFTIIVVVVVAVVVVVVDVVDVVDVVLVVDVVSAAGGGFLLWPVIPNLFSKPHKLFTAINIVLW